MGGFIMNKRKICIVTGTRAEFGLMQWLMHEVEEDKDLELQVIATGMHLSPEFGFTYRAIEERGFTINKKIEMLLSSDSSVGISKSMGLGMISFSEAYNEIKPDIIVVLGDRFEAFSAVSSAMIAGIPIAHIHGGEATEGLVDEPIRHSITKMSHLHFTATKAYAKRVMQLGEQPDRVFETGTPGLDNIERLTLLNKTEFEKSIDFKLRDKNIIITYHPVTLERNTAKSQFKELLDAIDCFPDIGVIITMPNADTDGRIIIKMINEYQGKNADRVKVFTSLGQLRYLSALQYVDVVVGNSSSGLIEAPSFKIPTVNIGERQKGRIKAKSVVDCDPTCESITNALKTVFSASFRGNLKDMVNPYGTGGASKKIKSILKDYPLNNILKKSFYDL